MQQYPKDTSTGPRAPQVGATITDQVQTVEPAPNGQVVRGYRVHFTIPSGQGGSVFVPEAQYTENGVRAAVAAQAGVMAALHNSQV